MKRTLRYHGKLLEQMTREELREQLDWNRQRLLLRLGIGAIVALATLTVHPVLGLVNCLLCLLPCYDPWQNIRALAARLDALRIDGTSADPFRKKLFRSEKWKVE